MFSGSHCPYMEWTSSPKQMTLRTVKAGSISSPSFSLLQRYLSSILEQCQSKRGRGGYLVCARICAGTVQENWSKLQASSSPQLPCANKGKPLPIHRQGQVQADSAFPTCLHFPPPYNSTDMEQCWSKQGLMRVEHALGQSWQTIQSLRQLNLLPLHAPWQWPS